ncbi:hypothetical protein, partial [Ralstonia solanacearum]|uniref:hypothetical protein n=2 Tax=Ralstonia TaxID=48736 RepID=UPI00057E8A36
LAAVNVASDLSPMFNKVYGDVDIEDFASLDKALHQIALRAQNEFSACGSLTESRRRALNDAAAEVEAARASAEVGNLVDMTNALKRAVGRLNALAVDVMTNMG